MKHNIKSHRQKHFDNIRKISEGKKIDIEKDYAYLNYCFRCGKKLNYIDKLTFNISHCFLGNYHTYYRCKEEGEKK